MNGQTRQFLKNQVKQILERFVAPPSLQASTKISLAEVEYAQAQIVAAGSRRDELLENVNSKAQAKISLLRSLIVAVGEAQEAEVVEVYAKWHGSKAEVLTQVSETLADLENQVSLAREREELAETERLGALDALQDTLTAEERDLRTQIEQATFDANGFASRTVRWGELIRQQQDEERAAAAAMRQSAVAVMESLNNQIELLAVQIDT